MLKQVNLEQHDMVVQTKQASSEEAGRADAQTTQASHSQGMHWMQAVDAIRPNASLWVPCEHAFAWPAEQ